jgi:hypothetical protein
MSSKRLYRLLIGLLIIQVIAMVGGAYGINSLLETKSKQTVAQKAKVAALEAQRSNLTQAKKDINTYADLYKISKTIVPESKDQAEIVRQIVKIANKNNIAIASITFPPSTLGTSSKPTTPGAATVKPLSAAVSNGKLSLSQLLKVPNIPGVYILITEIQEDTKLPVTYPQLISFLNDIEQNRLTAEVTSIEITPSQGSFSQFSFKLNLNSYIKP